MKAHGCYNLVFSSSCTVYGNPTTLPITEEHPTGDVTNVYGRTKYFVEEMLKDVSVAEKVSTHPTKWNNYNNYYITQCVEKSKIIITSPNSNTILLIIYLTSLI